MRIEILDEAEADLIEGYHFYKAQDAGLGSYFLDSLFSDIDSLLIHAGMHAVVFGYLQLKWRFGPMDAEDLRVFEAVARSGGITRASEILHTVQSNVTSRIQRLEAEGAKHLRRDFRAGGTLLNSFLTSYPFTSFPGSHGIANRPAAS